MVAPRTRPARTEETAREPEPRVGIPQRRSLIRPLVGVPAGDSRVQREAEAVMLDARSEVLRVPLFPERILLPDGTRVEVDGSVTNHQFSLELGLTKGCRSLPRGTRCWAMH
jgi:hypothetical protein